MTAAAPAFVVAEHGAELRREIRERYAGLGARSHADILGIPSSADAARVRAAFRDLARRFHPDRLSDLEDDLRGQAQAVFARITEAYQSLVAGCRPGSETRDASRAPARKADHFDPPPVARPVPPPPAPSARARVEQGLSEAASLVARDEGERAIGVLHDVLVRADEAQKRRARLLLARAYALVPKWREYGRRLLQEMTQQDPTDAEPLAALGALYLSEGLLARADATLCRALTADPGHAEARAQLRVLRQVLERRQATEAAPRPRRRPVARLLTREG